MQICSATGIGKSEAKVGSSRTGPRPPLALHYYSGQVRYELPSQRRRTVAEQTCIRVCSAPTVDSGERTSRAKATEDGYREGTCDGAEQTCTRVCSATGIGKSEAKVGSSRTGPRQPLALHYYSGQVRYELPSQRRRTVAEQTCIRVCSAPTVDSGELTVGGTFVGGDARRIVPGSRTRSS